MKEKYWILDCEKIEPGTRNIINEYLLSLKEDEKRAAATIDKYRRIIEQFFVEAEKSSLEELTSGVVLDWRDTCCIDRSKRTVRLYLTVLSNFSRFCISKNYIDRILTKKRWFPEIPDSLPKFLNSAEVARLRIYAEKLCLRDRAIISFMLSSGCRRHEVTGLNVEDINFQDRAAKVMGKGDKTRTVHFSFECSLLLKKYLAQNPRNEGPLFLNRYGDRLGDGSIYEITAKLKRAADLPSYFSPHSTRHTFACDMLARGADILFIAAELGHEDANTTRIYAKIPTEDLFREYNRIMR